MMDLPRENIYGHTKKLVFIIENINRYIHKYKNEIVVLDFGCGNGTAVSQYLINQRTKYYGVDIHESSLEYARMNYSNANALFLETIPDRVLFDVIIYADIIEHLEDPLSVLQQHINYLKEGGIIIGAIPNGFGPFENEKRLDKWLGLSNALPFLSKFKRCFTGSESSESIIIPYNSTCGHVQFFTRKKFCLVLEKAGFQIECIRNGVFAGAPFSERVLLRNEKIAKLNAIVADFLPYWAVSTWLFVARKVKR